MSESISEVARLLQAWPFEPSNWAGEGVVPFGEDVLHTPTVEVDAVTDEIRVIADYMIAVMHERDGIGLAANQIGLPLRMFVHNMPRVAPPVIINPVIVERSGTWTYHEGCLSMTIDGTHAPLDRPKQLVIDCLDGRGRQVRIDADELLARVFQHEIDHLDGILYAERLSAPHRRRVFQLMERHGVPVGRLEDRR